MRSTLCCLLWQSVTVLGSVGQNLEVLCQKKSSCWYWKHNMQSLSVIRDRFCPEQGSSRGRSSLFPCCEPCRQGADLYLQSSACAVELGVVKSLLCLRRAAQKYECGLKTVVSEEHTSQGTFLLRSSSFRSLNGTIFFKINCFAPAIELFSCWEEHPSPPDVVTL